VHRSRLTAISIDVPADRHRTAVEFWAGAIGGTAEWRDDPNDPNVTVGWSRGVELFVQRVGDPGPRIHFDIETDDVEAEVARLERLGAERVGAIKTWWIMRDPAGVVFCVVAPQGGDFPDGAVTWEG
jgi:Glyoxalase-like domain